jgi:hypothetical protein
MGGKAWVARVEL